MEACIYGHETKNHQKNAAENKKQQQTHPTEHRCFATRGLRLSIPLCRATTIVEPTIATSSSASMQQTDEQRTTAQSNGGKS
jgi:hypothetical protein